MSSKQLPQENETAGPEEDLSGNKLKDLEQHISQRINRLSDAELAALDLEQDGDSLLETSSFIPPFEPMEPFSFPEIGSAEPDYHNVYEGVRSSYQGISELLISVHELGDILTESVLSLNVRLNSIEQRLIELSGEGGGNTQEISGELKTLLQQSQSLLKQNLSASKNKSDGTKDSKDGAGSRPDLLHEFQQQLKLLEDHVSKSTKEAKQKVDERHSQLREHLDIRAKVLEKLSTDNREYLNRHFFSLAILFIIVVFIASALITNSVDRLSNYLNEQQEALHLQLDQLSQQHTRVSSESTHP